MSTAPAAPDYMQAFDDSDWHYYVHGHDPDEVKQIDDPEELEWEALFMRPIKASEAEDYGCSLDDPETVVRDRATGRYEPRWFWLECGAEHRDAEPFLGVKYKPA